MADDPTTPPADPAKGTPGTDPADPTSSKPDPDPADLGDAGKRAIKAEREARQAAEKAAKDLAAKLKELEDRDKTEAERLTEAKVAAEQKAAEALAEALRYKVATRFGINDEDAGLYLTGNDEATLVRQAERLAELAKASGATPKPDLTQGGKGTPALNSSALEESLRRAVGAT